MEIEVNMMFNITKVLDNIFVVDATKKEERQAETTSEDLYRPKMYGSYGIY